jgi:Zn-dependent protease with chaperone function
MVEGHGERAQSERHYATPGAIRREQAYRRAVLLGMAALLVLVMSPLFGHHLPIGLDALLVGRDHIWALCVIALHALLGPVHSGFHFLFLAGLAYAAWDRARAWRSVGRALAPYAMLPPDPASASWRAARTAGVDPTHLRVVLGLPTPAFTAGWLRPRIYVAAELEERLSEDELAAVLAHEAAHATRRDPLRLSLLRFLGCTLFWIPALRRLAIDVAAEGEVRADNHAARGHGLALASALVQLARWERGDRRVGVRFTGDDLLERRVLRLTGEEVPPHSSVTRRSLAGAAVALLLTWSSGMAVAHPLPTAHDAHCDEHAGAPVYHLFCSSCAHGKAEECTHGGGSH